MVEALLDELGRFLDAVDLLQALYLQVFIRDNPLLHLVDGYLDQIEAREDLLNLVLHWFISVDLGLKVLDLSLHALDLLVDVWRRAVLVGVIVDEVDDILLDLFAVCLGVVVVPVVLVVGASAIVKLMEVLLNEVTILADL